ncbi:MAG: hypothetical protein EOM20_16985 [Spartobacteria bacterium]|nr:hypothetical protein [Spartobacteria bacterium]
MDKPHHNTLLRFVTGILLLVATLTAEAQYNQVRLQATLILANNEGAPLDYRLDKVERSLRKIFGFKFYKFLGEDATAISLPSTLTLNPGHGCKLVIDASDAGDGKVRAQVRWIQDSVEVLSTSVRVKRRAPTILGGPAYGNGTLILSLTAE